jgi:hypothetical protein
VITTNLAFKEWGAVFPGAACVGALKEWGAVFPGAACVGALVDRFVERCHDIDIDVDSWRQKRASAALSDPRRRKAKS